MTSKQTKLREEIFLFEQTDRTVEDYQRLAIAFRRALAPDDGLIWSQFDEAVRQGLEDRAAQIKHFEENEDQMPPL